MDTNQLLLAALLTAPETKKNEALRVLRGEALEPAVRPELPEPYRSMTEVVKLSGISRSSWDRWRAPGHELGGRKRYRLTECLAYLETEEFKARAEALKRERRVKRIQATKESN